MPVLLDGVVNYPTNFAPFYIYEATLVASPASFEYLDMLFPDASGNFDRVVSDAPVLTAGYAFALAKFVTGMTTVPVAVVGSAIPFIAYDNTLKPCCMVQLKYASSVQSAVIADATAFAAGKVFGRFRNHHDNAKILKLTAADDIIIILTGAA